jgi:adenylylsulfate kinase-like enzyme
MMTIKNNKRNGIWFFGLAGSGKTFASKTCASIIENSFVIDGDEVRSLISFDLGYSMPERKIQLKRVLGLAQLVQNNCSFPIVSTVTMTDEIFQKCYNIEVDVVQIVRPIKQLNQIRTIYQTDQNVIGKDIQLEEINTPKLYNNGGEEFEEAVAKYIK